MKQNLLFLILCVFVLLSLPQLINRELWFDELASIQVSKQNLPRLLEMTAHDTHPPLYFLLLKGWSQITQNIYFLRLFSVVFGIGTLIVMWHITHKLLTSKTAAVSTFLLALSPLNVYYSTEIRMYGLFLFEIILLISLFLQWITKPSKINRLLLIILMLAAIYTHYYSVLVLISLSIWLWVKKRQLFNKWLLFLFFAGVLYLPWIIFATQFPKPNCWCFSPQVGIPVLFSAFAIGSVGMVTVKDVLLFGPFHIVILFGTTGAILVLLFFIGFRSRSVIHSLILYIFLFPLIIASAIGLFSSTFSPRAFMFLLPFYFIYAAHGITTLKFLSKKVLTIVCILLTVTSIFQSMDPFFTYIPPAKRNLDIYNLLFFKP